MKTFFNHPTMVITMVLFSFSSILTAQLIHPGMAHKKSDLDRMKAMVEAQVDPWYSTFQTLSNDSKASYDYTVRGNTSLTEVYRDSPFTNKSEFESDSRAAHFNAYMWYITGDERHAEKAVEVFNAWTGLTYVQHYGTHTLTASMIYIMLEAAEIIRHTYDGWSEADIKKFEDMLVYPGYSNTEVPDDLETQGTWYWRTYNGDYARAGNQELSGWRAIMAIGIFLDNEIIYDRALRYVSGLPHRPDDLAYNSGPSVTDGIIAETPYNIAYDFKHLEDIEDYGFDGVLTNYIYETGQNAESSRDQGHAGWGLNLLNHLAEMAWNQGDNLYGLEDNRLLLGLEHYTRYNLSYLASYPDQTNPWEPTVANGNFVSRLNRVARTKALAINPFFEYNYENVSRGGVQTRGYWELPTNHYVGRGIVSEEEAKWLVRTRDYAISQVGWERSDNGGSHVGWGGLTFRRPELCFGDPLIGFTFGVPNFGMNQIPGTIEAENFDYSPINGNGRTYNDANTTNNGGQYRTNESVDIENSADGGFNVGWMEPGEWLSYTVNVPENGTYDIAIRYAATNDNGTITFEFGGIDRTGEINIPTTNGWQNWQSLTVAEGVLLPKGVQNLRVKVGGSSMAYNLNHFTISNATSCAKEVSEIPSSLEPGISYKYYEGDWELLPDFNALSVVSTGISDEINLGHGERSDYFGYVYEGFVEIETDGDYTFFTRSDDGSSLYIDDIKIVDNDGTHGFEERSGGICLQAGFHKIRVEYFDQTQGDDLIVSYDGPNFSKTTLKALFHDSDDSDITNENEDGTIVHLSKRNATNFAIDGDNGGEDGQNIYLWSSNSTNANQLWMEIDRGNGYYSYQKYGTNYCIDGNDGGENGQNVYLWTCNANNQNQHWKKVNVGDGTYRFEKRNAPDFALDGNDGGKNEQNIYLWSAGDNNQNQQWVLNAVKSSDIVLEKDESKAAFYPVPFTDVLNIVIDDDMDLGKVEIIDASGATRFTTTISNNTEALNLSALSQGFYIIKITTLNNVYTKTIIKQ